MAKKPDDPKKPRLRNGLIKPPGYEFYQYHFRFRGTVQKGTTKCASYADALVYKEALIKQLNEEYIGLKEKKTPQAMTLGEIHKKWIGLRGIEVSQSHLDDMRMAVTVHASNYIDKPITELNNLAAMTIRSDYLKTNAEIIGYRGKKFTRNHTEGGANQMIKNLYALCGWAVEVDIIKKRPFKIKNLNVTDPDHTILWPEQVEGFLAHIDKGHRTKIGTTPEGKVITEMCPHSATAARMMMFMGLREGETRYAEWGHIDWRTKQFTVGRGIVVDHDPKDREKRKIPIPPTLFAHLQARWEEAGKPANGLILPDNGNAKRKPKPNTPHVEQFTKKNIERSGNLITSPGLTPHSLRRTFASGHYEIGTPIGQIAKLMGHASPETTLKHYIVTREKDQVEAQDKLDAAFARKPSQTTSPDPEASIKVKKGIPHLVT